MASALENLKQCAQAIHDKDLKAAEDLMARICNLADAETDKAGKKVVKYFAEALVRRAYGLHPTNPEFTFLTPPYASSILADARWLVNDAIATLVTGKNRVHIVDFCLLNLYDWQCLFVTLGKRSGRNTSVRISVIVPPLLENSADFQLTYHHLRMRAEFENVELEKLKVVKANSLGEVDASMLEFRRTEDEAVVVNYMFNLHVLLAEPGAMEKELLKLKQINPEIVIILEQDANLNDFNFNKRLEDTFQYYSMTTAWRIIIGEK